MPATSTPDLQRHQPSTAQPLVTRQRGNELLRIEGLTKRYGDQLALDQVTFSVHAGEVLGLIGPNGSGKTTLLECLAGLLPADAGEFLWAGATLPPACRKRVMVYLPDGISPWADQSAENILLFAGRAHGRPQSDVVEAATKVGLGPVLEKRITALSKGYRRRLVLALGLIAPQPLLVMDEPFDGFDLRQTREVMALLRDVAARGRTLLLSIHQLADAERICDRVVLLSGGRVRGEGTVAELRTLASVGPGGGLEEVFLALA